MSRSTTQARNVSNTAVALQADGVHQKLRTAATAKFLHEVFPHTFPADMATASSGSNPIPKIADAIEQLWHKFRQLLPHDKSTCDGVILHTQQLIKAPTDHWDTVTFYSSKIERRLHITMPLKHVLAAIATLVIDKDDTYFKEKDSTAARKARLTQLFTNLQQLKNGPNLCHTGVRDAFVAVMNGVSFHLHEQPCCYRFPEYLPAFLQALQAEYIQKALSDYKAINPEKYQTHMIEWAALPDTEREMPEALKDIVWSFINKQETQSHYKNTLLSVGMNPSDPSVAQKYTHYFSYAALEYVDINAALGSAIYWHDVRRIFGLKSHNHPTYSEALKQLKKAIRRCPIDDQAVRTLHQHMQHFIKVVLCASYLRTHRSELSYQYEDGKELCANAKTVVDAFYTTYPGQALLSSGQSQILDQLINKVKHYIDNPLTNEFNSAFSLLFLNNGNTHRIQAQKIANPAFRGKCNIDPNWLDRHFSAKHAHDGELEINLATLNHFLLYVLLYPKADWCDRTAETLTISLDYLKNRLGNTEDDALERKQHLRLKKDSYQHLFTMLDCLANNSLIGAMNNDKLLRLISQVMKCNFYSLLPPIATLLETNDEKKLWLAAHEDIKNIFRAKAYYGNREAILFLLSNLNVDVNTARPDGVTALYMAAQEGHTAVVNALLAANDIDVNAAKTHGVTALYIAAEKGQTEVVNALLAANDIDVNAATTDGATALFIAAQEGHLEVVNALLAANDSDVNAAYSDGSTALFIAAQKGHTAVVNALLAANDIDVNAAKTHGVTALYIAAEIGHTEVVNALLAANDIDVNAAITNGVTALYIAAEKGHTEVVNALLAAKDSDVNAAYSDGSTALYIAAEIGHTEVVNALLAANDIDVNAAISDGSTALFIAAQKGHTEVVSALLAANGIDVNAAKTHGGTALIIAAQEGHLDVVNALLAAKDSDVNAAYSDGTTALFIAAQEGHLDVVNALLAANDIDVNAACTDGTTALFMAAQKGHTEVVSALLAANGIDVNAAKTNGATALIIAAQKGHLDVVNALLAANDIDVNAAITNGVTALYIAAQNGHVEAVNTLLTANGIDVNAAKTNGGTALLIAAEQGHAEVVSALLAANGIDVNAAITNGATALFIAAVQGHAEVVSALLAANGIDVNAAITNGVTALLIAAQKGHLDVVNTLLTANGIDVNAACSDGTTALYIAAQNGHVEVVNALLTANDSDVNAACSDGATALFIAAQEGHLDVVNTLLAANDIDVNAACTNGTTALFMAAQNGHTRVVQSLLEAKATTNTAKPNVATVLFIASLIGHKPIVKFLLAAASKAMVDAAKPNVATPLFTASLIVIASLTGHNPIVTYLLAAAAKATVGTATPNIPTPLFIAAQNGHSETVNALPFNAIPLVRTNKQLEQFIQNKSPAVQRRMRDHIRKSANQQKIHITPTQIARIIGHDATARELELRNPYKNRKILPRSEKSTTTNLRQIRQTFFTTHHRKNTNNSTTTASAHSCGISRR